MIILNRSFHFFESLSERTETYLNQLLNNTLKKITGITKLHTKKIYYPNMLTMLQRGTIDQYAGVSH